MITLQGINGNAIARSCNLRGPREWVSHHIIDRVEIARHRDGTGYLFVLFAEPCAIYRLKHPGLKKAARFGCEFADFSILVNVVSRWRNLQGVKIDVYREGERIFSISEESGGICRELVTMARDFGLIH